jgi:hypothetical protein
MPLKTFRVTSHKKKLLIAFTIVNQSQIEKNRPRNPTNRENPNEEQWRPYSQNPHFNQQTNIKTKKKVAAAPKL